MGEIRGFYSIKMHQQVLTLCYYFMKTIKPKNMIYTSLERYFNRASARFVALKSLQKWWKNCKLKLKYGFLSIHCCPQILTSLMFSGGGPMHARVPIQAHPQFS